MSIKLNFFVDSIQSKQSLVDDSVTYSLCGKLLGSNVVMPTSVDVIRRLDDVLQGEGLAPDPGYQEQAVPETIPTDLVDVIAPEGYDFGIMYGDDDE